MEAEEADLERKLAVVREFLAVYRPSAPKGAAKSPSPSREVRTFGDRIDKFGTYGKGVVDVVLTMLPSVSAEPILTRDLVVKLENNGIEIRGENKVNALSALLARSSKIKGHGRSGWTLMVEKEPKPPQEMMGADEAHKENEPTALSPVGSETVGLGVQPPAPAFGNPQSRWTS